MAPVGMRGYKQADGRRRRDGGLGGGEGPAGEQGAAGWAQLSRLGQPGGGTAVGLRWRQDAVARAAAARLCRRAAAPAAR